MVWLVIEIRISSGSCSPLSLRKDFQGIFNSKIILFSQKFSTSSLYATFFFVTGFCKACDETKKLHSSKNRNARFNPITRKSNQLHGLCIGSKYRTSYCNPFETQGFTIFCFPCTFFTMFV